MSEYGIVLENLGRYDEAVRVQRDGLDTALRTLGQEHPRASSFGEGLAWTLTMLGEYDEAIERSDAAIAARRRQFGTDHAQIEYDLINSADALIARGRLNEAERRLEQALAIARRISDTPGVYTMLAQWRLALIALDRHDLVGDATSDADARQLERAERLLDDASAIGNEALRPGHRYLLALGRTRARLLVRQGRAADAIALLQPIRDAEDVNLPSPHPARAETLRRLAEAHLLDGDAGAAERFAREALSELAGLPGTHWLVGETTTLLGRAVRALGRSAEGQTLIDDGRAIVESHLGPESAAARRIAAHAVASDPARR
jgi:tetratricopeptide (TPR) repeat protein